VLPSGSVTIAIVTPGRASVMDTVGLMPVNYSLSSMPCFDIRLVGLLQPPSYHCALPVDFADSLPRRSM